MKMNDGKALRGVKVCKKRKVHGKIKEEVEERLRVEDATSGNNRAALNTHVATLKTDERETHPQCADDAKALFDRKVEKEVASMKDDVRFGSAPELGKAIGIASKDKPRKTLRVDTDKYQAWLDDPSLSDDQREQIVEALWSIIISFVDLGFGVAPLQEACGKAKEIEHDSGDPALAVLKYDAETLTHSFNTHAAE